MAKYLGHTLALGACFVYELHGDVILKQQHPYTGLPLEGFIIHNKTGTVKYQSCKVCAPNVRGIHRHLIENIVAPKHPRYINLCDSCEHEFNIIIFWKSVVDKYEGWMFKYLFADTSPAGGVSPILHMLSIHCNAIAGVIDRTRTMRIEYGSKFLLLTSIGDVRIVIKQYIVTLIIADYED